MKTHAKRLLRPWLGPLRRYRDHRRRRAPMRLDLPLAGGRLDELIVRDGVVAALGWGPDLNTFERTLTLEVGDREARPPTHAFRVPRPDVERVFPRDAGFSGAVVEWILEPHAACGASLLVDGQPAHAFRLPALPDTPFGHLHTLTDIVGRDQIYGSGPPVHVVSDEVLYLARALPPPILDFGCGGGALVSALRREGIDAFGIELDEARIHDRLLDEARPWVTLYGGAFPSPFADRQFASVVSSEVLEHIPHPAAAVAEMARLATKRLMITVPDMSSIPRGFPYGAVPWHLLESTHVNFFTQHSLVEALRPHVHAVEMSRIGLREADQLRFYTSLAAIARLDE